LSFVVFHQKNGEQRFDIGAKISLVVNDEASFNFGPVNSNVSLNSNPGDIMLCNFCVKNYVILYQRLVRATKEQNYTVANINSNNLGKLIFF